MTLQKAGPTQPTTHKAGVPNQQRAHLVTHEHTGSHLVPPHEVMPDHYNLKHGCRYKVTFGHTWTHLVTSGHIWSHTWAHWVKSGPNWSHLVTHMGTLGHTSGNIWSQKVTSGHTLAPRFTYYTSGSTSLIPNFYKNRVTFCVHNLGIKWAPLFWAAL